MDDTSVDCACLGLSEAVKKFCKKYQKRFRGSACEKSKLQCIIDHLVAHANHILRMLTKKRASLRYAVEALRECWDESRNALEKSKLHNLRDVLNHLLQNYLRVSDGFVLLTSGECRHTGDYPEPGNLFKSQLTKNKIRSDGYTMLYSNHLKYSGFGWDEFFDSDYGVQARLLNALKQMSSKTSIWDYLIEHGARLFESCLDAHETQLLTIRKSFDEIRESVTTDLLKLLHKHAGGGGKVHFSTQDKMEFIEIKLRKEVAGMSSFKLQRRANEFQVKDHHGVLPNGWICYNWMSHMSLPSRIKSFVVSESMSGQRDEFSKAGDKKRRRVIDESSEDDNEGSLHLRENTVQEYTTPDTSSLNTIKAEMGVDVAELETSRETVEAEGAKPKPGQSEDQVIKSGMAHVRKARQILERALAQSQDPLEAWDARDLLREETMKLGNDLLCLHEQHLEYLSHARLCFREAIEISNQQEAAHKEIVKDSNDDTEGAWFICRNLMLLKGRAHVNHGIALLELSLVHVATPTAKKRHRAEAFVEIEYAQRCARDLHAKCLNDEKRGASAADTTLHRIEATQLETLALRSYGTALWHDNNYVLAEKVFHEAASTYRVMEESVLCFPDMDEELLSEYFKILVDCYHSATTLLDMVMDMLTGPNDPEQMWSIILERAAEKTKSIVFSIDELARKYSNTMSFECILHESGIPKMKDIDRTLAVVQRECNDIKNRVSSACDFSTGIRSKQIPRLPRNDLGIGLLIATGGMHRKREFVASSETQLQMPSGRKRARRDCDVQYFPKNEAEGTLLDCAVKIMKWGDELLETGREGSSSVLPFPASAPPLPHGFPSEYADLHKYLRTSASNI